jgi:hypothetical protein
LKKIFSYFLRALSVLAAIFVLIWVFFFAYLTLNKNRIIAKVKTQLNQQIKGNISIGDLKPDFLHAFPYPAIKITNVIIRDSLWYQHHHDFITAPVIYVRLKPLNLFDQKPAIGKISIQNGTIYFYIDSTDHSNIIKADSAGNNDNKDLPNLQFVDTRFILQDEHKHKLHDIFCEKLKCDIEKTGGFTKLTIKLKSLVHGLSFNTHKGSYLQEKYLEGKFELTLKDENLLQFKNVDLTIDRQPFLFSGKFLFDQKLFDLTIETKKANYEKVLTILPKVIREKMKSYHIDVPLSINAHLSGSLEYGSLPLTSINFETKKAQIVTPSSSFSNCAFTASFTNQATPALPVSDENAQIVCKDFSGSWENILLRSDSIIIKDLVHPVLSCSVTSIFKLKQLNELTGSNTMQFLSGEGNMNIHYSGSLINDSTSPAINGNIIFKNSEMSYLPRQFSLKNCKGTVVFKNQDVFISNLSATAGNNQLLMNGSVINLVTLLNTPEKLTINWNIYSPVLDISNFISYIGKRSGTINTSSKKKFFWIADKIDRMLKDGRADLHIQADRVNYKRFIAKNVSASILLLENKILLNGVRMSHAGGTIAIDGSLADESVSNRLNFTATLDHVNIPEVFYSFNNFGQDAITDKNMKGILSANVLMNGSLTNKAAIVQNSLGGKVDFSIENGELNNFEPVQKISETAFKKRDFSNLRFAELKNSIEINGSAIKIPSMEIHSNVLTMFVQGVYDVKLGTDMSIRVPVSNLKKPEPDIIPKNKNKAGVSIRLRARTGEDGKLKVTWDPFNKSGKANSDPKTSMLNKNY